MSKQDSKETPTAAGKPATEPVNAESPEILEAIAALNAVLSKTVVPPAKEGDDDGKPVH